MQPPDQADGDSAPDIVVAVLREVIDLGLLTPEQAGAVERRMKAQFGDRIVRVKKKLQFAEDQRRRQVYADGLTSMSTADIVAKHGVSRRTVYRWMKKGDPGT